MLRPGAQMAQNHTAPAGWIKGTPATADHHISTRSLATVWLRYDPVAILQHLGDQLGEFLPEFFVRSSHSAQILWFIHKVVPHGIQKRTVLPSLIVLE